MGNLNELYTQCFLAQTIRFSNPSSGISFFLLFHKHLTDLSSLPLPLSPHSEKPNLIKMNIAERITQF